MCACNVTVTSSTVTAAAVTFLQYWRALFRVLVRVRVRVRVRACVSIL